MKIKLLQLSIIGIFLHACGGSKMTKNPAALGGSTNTSGYQVDSLPAPYATPSAVNFSKVIGWKDGQAPIAPAGFTVTKFAVVSPAVGSPYK